MLSVCTEKLSGSHSRNKEKGDKDEDKFCTGGFEKI